ncbi:MAG: NAD(P)/FAD-dependent oxidoreductase [Tepidisphaeraceae bacterium]
MHHIPTLIIGAGVAGAGVACALAERGAGAGVRLVDVDVFGKHSSSELSAGGARCLFSEPLLAKLALASLKYYERHAEHIDFRQRGTLWFHDATMWEAARVFVPQLRAMGLPVEELAADELNARFNLLGDASDVAGATFTARDGSLCPHRLRLHYLNHAQAGDVELLDRFQVITIDGDAPPYQVRLRQVTPGKIKRALSTPIAPEPSSKATELTISVDRIVNAAGPWAGRVARLYGRALPVKPAPRQAYVLRPTEGMASKFEAAPFFVDAPGGIFWRHYDRDRKPCVLVCTREAGGLVDTVDFTPPGEARYRQNVEPRVARRVPTLASAALVMSWTGHDDLTPDHHPVIGPVPGRPGIHNLNGLSAAGISLSRGLAEALAYRLIDNRWPSDLDLDVLSESRFDQPSAAAVTTERLVL